MRNIYTTSEARELRRHLVDLCMHRRITARGYWRFLEQHTINGMLAFVFKQDVPGFGQHTLLAALAVRLNELKNRDTRYLRIGRISVSLSSGRVFMNVRMPSVDTWAAIEPALEELIGLLAAEPFQTADLECYSGRPVLEALSACGWSHVNGCEWLEDTLSKAVTGELPVNQVPLMAMKYVEALRPGFLRNGAHAVHA